MSGAGVQVETRDLPDLAAFFKRLPEIADRAAQMSVNDSARFARRVGGVQVLDEINYPRSYLGNERDGRLAITKFATRGDAEAEVRGRDRPTSLARFAMQRVKFGRQRGIKVQVSRGGSTQQLQRAFFMKLRRGNTFDGENFNVGLAVRLKKGERLQNSTAALELGNGLYLLYGPSVDQVFGGVAEDIIDSVSDHLEDEFIRQFERLSNDG